MQPVTDHLQAGGLMRDRIRERAPNIRRVDEMADLQALLEMDPQEMAKRISGQLPAAFIGYDGEAVGDMAGDGASHVVQQRWLVVLVVGNYRRADTKQGVTDEAGPLLSQLIPALSGWAPAGFTALLRRTAPRPGYLAGMGFFPLVFDTTLAIDGLTED